MPMGGGGGGGGNADCHLHGWVNIADSSTCSGEVKLPPSQMYSTCNIIIHCSHIVLHMSRQPFNIIKTPTNHHPPTTPPFNAHHTISTTNLPMLMVDHDVVRLNVSVHDPHTVAVVQGLQQLKEIEPDVVVCQVLVQLLLRE